MATVGRRSNHIVVLLNKPGIAAVLQTGGQLEQHAAHTVHLEMLAGENPSRETVGAVNQGNQRRGNQGRGETRQGMDQGSDLFQEYELEGQQKWLLPKPRSRPGAYERAVTDAVQARATMLHLR